MAISAADVKRLRELTGAGMMDCKKALEESDGDFDKAVEFLRIKGAKDIGKWAERSTPAIVGRSRRRLRRQWPRPGATCAHGEEARQGHRHQDSGQGLRSSTRRPCLHVPVARG